MRTEVPTASAEILLLSDRQNEIHLVRDAADADHINVVEVCPAVLAFLRREGRYRESPRPDLILLDLDLSNPDHCDTLLGIKEDPDFRRIPVVVIAPDASHDAIQDAYDLHANAYIVKPRDPAEFVRVIKATLNFWLKLARLPKE